MREPKWLTPIIDFFDGFLAWVLTALGILVSQWLPAFQAGQEINLKLSIGRLAVSALIAFTLVADQEGGVDTPEKRAGRRSNFRRRMSAAVLHGLGWSSFLHLAGMP